MQEFQKVQLQFADHIRDPIGNAPVSGLEERRLQIYRDLFFNNVLVLGQFSFFWTRIVYPESGPSPLPQIPWCPRYTQFQ